MTGLEGVSGAFLPAAPGPTFLAVTGWRALIWTAVLTAVLLDAVVSAAAGAR
jgi:hypothetical protein